MERCETFDTQINKIDADFTPHFEAFITQIVTAQCQYHMREKLDGDSEIERLDSLIDQFRTNKGALINSLRQSSLAEQRRKIRRVPDNIEPKLDAPEPMEASPPTEPDPQASSSSDPDPRAPASSEDDEPPTAASSLATASGEAKEPAKIDKQPSKRTSKRTLGQPSTDPLKRPKTDPSKGPQAEPSKRLCGDCGAPITEKPVLCDLWKAKGERACLLKSCFHQKCADLHRGNGNGKADSILACSSCVKRFKFCHVKVPCPSLSEPFYGILLVPVTAPPDAPVDPGALKGSFLYSCVNGSVVNATFEAFCTSNARDFNQVAEVTECLIAAKEKGAYLNSPLKTTKIKLFSKIDDRAFKDSLAVQCAFESI